MPQVVQNREMPLNAVSQPSNSGRALAKRHDKLALPVSHWPAAYRAGQPAPGLILIWLERVSRARPSRGSPRIEVWVGIDLLSKVARSRSCR